MRGKENKQAILMNMAREIDQSQSIISERYNNNLYHAHMLNCMYCITLHLLIYIHN